MTANNWPNSVDLVDRAKYPARFFVWLNTEPGRKVWRAFNALAQQMAAKRKRYGAMALCEVIRWETAVAGGDDFKLNNNWVPGLARLWMHFHSDEHPKFFAIRNSQGFDE